MNTRWEAVEVGMSDFGPDAVPMYEVLTVDGHKRVCEHVSQADAHLIAAAPAMLAALVDAIECIPERARPVLLKQARAAIAAATGEQA